MFFFLAITKNHSIRILYELKLYKIQEPGAGCSKLMTSLVNVLLKFKMLILQIHCYFFVGKM